MASKSKDGPSQPPQSQQRVPAQIKSDDFLPWKLWAAIGCLLALDIILLTIWTIVDPLDRSVHLFPIEPSLDDELDIVIQPQLEHCVSIHQNAWMGIIYAYKGLQLILGLFLAYETRSYKFKQINDSRLVGMSIYNVVVLCMITAPVMLVIGNQQNASFTFVSLANLFCCFLSMALIMVPKIIFIRKHAHDPREKEDDEKEEKEQELKYREVIRENETLQKSIAEKEKKLARLKEMTDQREPKPSPQSSATVGLLPALTSSMAPATAAAFTSNVVQASAVANAAAAAASSAHLSSPQHNNSCSSSVIPTSTSATVTNSGDKPLPQPPVGPPGGVPSEPYQNNTIGSSNGLRHRHQATTPVNGGGPAVSTPNATSYYANDTLSEDQLSGGRLCASKVPAVGVNAYARTNLGSTSYAEDHVESYL